MDCAIVSSTLAGLAAELGIRCSPGSDIAVMISELEWLGSFSPEDPQPHTAHRVDRERSLRAFPMFEQARRVARALLVTQSMPGSSERARHLRKRFDRLKTQNELAQDVLFEIEMAGKLAEAGIPIAFEEPDIIAFPSQPTEIAFACKRPRTSKAIKQCLRDASRQICDSGRDGVILIGVEAILHRDEPTGRPITYTTPISDLQPFGRHKLDQSLGSLNPSLAGAFRSDQVLGVIFCGILTAWARTEYRYAWIRRSIPNLTQVSSGTLLAVIEERMFPE